jgi:hypothetical protein
MQKTSKLKKLASHLLATTCLTVAAGSVAMAGTYTGPYGSSFGTATNVGTSTPITGTVTLNGPEQEWFEISALPAGVTLASVLTIQDVSGNAVEYWVENDAAGVIDNQTISSPNFASINGNVPVDGNVVVEFLATNEGASNWAVTVNASTPEPGTVAAVGVGLVGLAAAGLRRRKKA